MSAEDVQDAIPEKTAPENKPLTIEERIVNVTGVTGMSMILGPDVVVGLTNLPDGSQNYVILAGTTLVIRAILMHLILREDRRS